MLMSIHSVVVYRHRRQLREAHRPEERLLGAVHVDVAVQVARLGAIEASFSARPRMVGLVDALALLEKLLSERLEQRRLAQPQVMMFRRIFQQIEDAALDARRGRSLVCTVWIDLAGPDTEPHLPAEDDLEVRT